MGLLRQPHPRQSRRPLTTIDAFKAKETNQFGVSVSKVSLSKGEFQLLPKLSVIKDKHVRNIEESDHPGVLIHHRCSQDQRARAVFNAPLFA